MSEQPGGVLSMSVADDGTLALRFRDPVRKRLHTVELAPAEARRFVGDIQRALDETIITRKVD